MPQYLEHVFLSFVLRLSLFKSKLHFHIIGALTQKHLDFSHLDNVSLCKLANRILVVGVNNTEAFTGDTTHIHTVSNGLGYYLTVTHI